MKRLNDRGLRNKNEKYRKKVFLDKSNVVIEFNNGSEWAKDNLVKGVTQFSIYQSLRIVENKNNNNVTLNYVGNNLYELLNKNVISFDEVLSTLNDFLLKINSKIISRKPIHPYFDRIILEKIDNAIPNPSLIYLKLKEIEHLLSSFSESCIEVIIGINDPSLTNLTLFKNKLCIVDFDHFTNSINKDVFTGFFISDYCCEFNLTEYKKYSLYFSNNYFIEGFTARLIIEITDPVRINWGKEKQYSCLLELLKYLIDNLEKNSTQHCQ